LGKVFAGRVWASFVLCFIPVALELGGMKVLSIFGIEINC